MHIFYIFLTIVHIACVSMPSANRHICNMYCIQVNPSPDIEGSMNVATTVLAPAGASQYVDHPERSPRVIATTDSVQASVGMPPQLGSGVLYDSASKMALIRHAAVDKVCHDEIQTKVLAHVSSTNETNCRVRMVNNFNHDLVSVLL